MISYHPDRGRHAAAYATGFLTVDTNAVERVGRGIARFAWSPIIWQGGRRGRENFLRADWAVLDFDSGELTLSEARARWRDHIHIIGTTRSHGVAKDGRLACDRFRVALLFEAPITSLTDYEYTMRRLISALPADPAAKDGARFFYPCREIVAASAAGVAVSPDHAPRPTPADTKARLASYRFERWGQMPTWLDEFLRFGRVPPPGRNQTVFRAAAKLTELGVSEPRIREMIAAAPFERDGFTTTEASRTITNGIHAAGGG